MSEVIIDDSSLNAIANAIRRKNGLVRTYKPREMAPAIRALQGVAPSSHGYTIKINQSPHQYITVKLRQRPQIVDYEETFTVNEPMWTFEASIEADWGYRAGKLNYVNETSIDRDYVIEATPAIYDPENDGIMRVYTNGYTYNGSYQSNWFLQLYSDSTCTRTIGKQYLGGKVQILFNDTGYRPLFGQGGISFLGTPNNNGSGDNGRIAGDVKEVYLPLLDTRDWNDMRFFAMNCGQLQKIYGFEDWDLSNVTDFGEAFEGCRNLRSINLADQTMDSLVRTYQMFNGCTVLRTLDLSGWTTQNLMYCNEMFSGCSCLEVLDISNWNTSSLTENLNLPSNLHYLIMDKREVKFVNNGKCNKPNNYIKYLVPTDMVLEYKEHPDWSSRASQIDDIANYTITRYDGQVFVTPRV